MISSIVGERLLPGANNQGPQNLHRHPRFAVPHIVVVHTGLYLTVVVFATFTSIFVVHSSPHSRLAVSFAQKGFSPAYLHLMNVYRRRAMLE